MAGRRAVADKTLRAAGLAALVACVRVAIERTATREVVACIVAFGVEKKCYKAVLLIPNGSQRVFWRGIRSGGKERKGSPIQKKMKLSGKEY